MGLAVQQALLDGGQGALVSGVLVLQADGAGVAVCFEFGQQLFPVQLAAAGDAVAPPAEIGQDAGLGQAGPVDGGVLGVDVEDLDRKSVV